MSRKTRKKNDRKVPSVMNPPCLLMDSRSRAKQRAMARRYGRQVFARLPINQRLHYVNHGSHLPRITR